MQSDQCLNCARFWLSGGCEAFPSGIPEEILRGEFDHTRPYPGDNGLRYVPLKAEAPQRG